MGLASDGRSRELVSAAVRRTSEGSEEEWSIRGPSKASALKFSLTTLTYRLSLVKKMSLLHIIGARE